MTAAPLHPDVRTDAGVLANPPPVSGPLAEASYRIYLFQQFHTGPSAPGSLQPRKLAQVLASRGHRVTVVATDFNAYNEQPEPGEKLTGAHGGSVEVRRLPSSRGMRASLGARLRTYLGFAWQAYRFGRTLPAPDLVIGSIQPLFTGLVARRLARSWRRPFLLEVRDLWPDALEAKGAIRSWQAWPLHRLANTLYAGADRIVCLTPGIKQVLLRKQFPAGRIDVFPNGFDPELFEVPSGTRERVRNELGWNGRFVALFAGTHVEVTAVETIVRAAAVLRDHAEVRFDLFGRGQRKRAAIELARSLGLTNIHFHDPVPKRRIPELLAAADVALMTLFKSPLIDIYFENKLMDYTGAGVPILAAMDGMQSELLRRFRCGRTVGSFDHAGLAQLVREAAAEPAALKEFGRNGARFARERLLLNDILARYAGVIEALASGRGRSLDTWEPALGC
jgi:glycosyltransferase involved in cell wall biosynthesis